MKSLRASDIGNRKETAVSRCPCCAAPLPPDFAAWDEAAGILVAGGREMQFTRSEAKVFGALWSSRNQSFLTLDRLEDIVYRDDPEGGSLSGLVRRHVCNVRKKIEAAGMGVKNTYGYGYRLVQKREAAS